MRKEIILFIGISISVIACKKSSSDSSGLIYFPNESATINGQIVSLSGYGYSSLGYICYGPHCTPKDVTLKIENTNSPPTSPTGIYPVTNIQSILLAVPGYNVSYAAFPASMMITTKKGQNAETTNTAWINITIPHHYYESQSDTVIITKSDSNYVAGTYGATIVDDSTMTTSHVTGTFSGYLK